MWLANAFWIKYSKAYSSRIQFDKFKMVWARFFSNRLTNLAASYLGALCLGDLQWVILDFGEMKVLSVPTVDLLLFMIVDWFQLSWLNYFFFLVIKPQCEFLTYLLGLAPNDYLIEYRFFSITSECLCCAAYFISLDYL